VGYRNAQVTVLAPTGTIAFLMDCDTTGVEPDIALVKYKLLAGGGLLKIVNRTVPEALCRLGYSVEETERIIAHIEKYDTIEDVTDGDQTATSGLKPEHLPVFDCAFKPYRGKRSIQSLAHLKMMGAAQPFISGAISKTVNMPNDSTAEDIRDAYVQAWKMGLKCVAIYRDGSKRSQPLNTKRSNSGADKAPAVDSSALQARIKELEAEVTRLAAQAGKPLRRRLTDTRTAITHKFDIAGHEGYLTVGLFEKGQPGELFITMAKEGSTIGGRCNTAFRWKPWSESLPTCASSLRASPRIPTSAMRHLSPIMSSVGWGCNSSPASGRATRRTATSRSWLFPVCRKRRRRRSTGPCRSWPSRTTWTFWKGRPATVAMARAMRPPSPSSLSGR
jgi:ribonucleoside-diphosphate reductase alpha chain